MQPWLITLPLLYSLFFPHLFPLPKSQSYLFFSPQVQVETEVEQREGGTAKPSHGPAAQRLGRRESLAEGRGWTGEGGNK